MGDIQTQTRFVGSDGNVYGGTFTPGPTNANDPRLRDLHLYLEDESTPRWLLMTPQPNR